MSSITTKQARTEMSRKVKAALDLFPQLVVRWDTVVNWATPDATKQWAWPHVQHVNSQQASLSCEHGLRRWRREGILTVQCFGLTYDKAEDIATALRNEFEGTATPSDVWFRNATANEVGPDSSWYRFDFQVAFQYDQVR